MTTKPELFQDAQYALSVESGEATHPKDFDWMEKNVPCRSACPAGTHIPGYLDEIRQGNFEKAYRINLEDNIFPAVLGRACTRPCEDACRHGWPGLGDSVAICFAKRSAEEFAAKAPVVLEPKFPATGKKITIVGAGVSGLAMARELRAWGHGVLLLEKHSEPGGLMVQGIPEFRLPREHVQREIEQITAMGVEIRCGVTIGSVEQLRSHKADCDVLIVAVGAHVTALPDLPGQELDGVEHGLEFLKRVNAGGRPNLGSNVVVIGGGFTAVDCARMAQRLGSKEVGMYYRRSEEEMYIGQHELTQFKHEGVEHQFMVSPVELLGEGGKLTAVRFVRTELKKAEGDDRARPHPIAGSEFDVPADTALFGTGQTSVVDDWSAMKDDEGVYVAGDAATGASSLIDAIGHGKSVAREVDKALMGTNRFREILTVEDVLGTGRKREMDEIPLQEMPELPVDGRGVIDEVETGLPRDAALEEASRCYLCHYKFEIDNELCIYCDRCLKVTPVDNCIVKASSLIYDDADRISGHIPSTKNANYNMLYLDQNECIRCGACTEVCPVECITIQKVTPQLVTR